MSKEELINALEMEREDLANKLNSLEITILTLKQSMYVANSLPTNGNLIPNQPKDSSKLYGRVIKHYNEAKSYRDKVVVILKSEGRFLHMRQIISVAETLEPQADPDKLANSIRQAVYALKNMENAPIVAKAINNVNINTFWGSKNWLDSEGNIKPEHMFDKNEVAGIKKEVIEI